MVIVGEIGHEGKPKGMHITKGHNLTIFSPNHQPAFDVDSSTTKIAKYSLLRFMNLRRVLPVPEEKRWDASRLRSPYPKFCNKASYQINVLQKRLILMRNPNISSLH